MDTDNSVSVVLGGSYEQLPLILEWQSRGFAVVVFDANDQSPGAEVANDFFPISVRNHTEIRAILDSLGAIAAVSSIASQAAVESVALLAQDFGLAGLKPEMASKMIDKRWVKDQLHRPGSEARPRLPSQMGNTQTPDSLSYPIVVKPSKSSGGKGISIVRSLDELNDAVKMAQGISADSGFFLEPYIAGRQFDVPLLAQNGEVLAIGIIEEFYPPFSGKPIGYKSPPDIEARLQAKIMAFARDVTETVGFTFGAAHCEVRLDEQDSLHLIEFDPRMGGEEWHRIVEWSTGYRYLAHFVNLHLGVTAPVPDGSGKHDVGLVYCPTPHSEIGLDGSGWQLAFTRDQNSAAPTANGVRSYDVLVRNRSASQPENATIKGGKHD